jgi:hypothetical protein
VGSVRNERLKLLATAFSNLAVATVVAAVIIPAVGTIYGATSAPTGHWYLWAVAWLLIGSMLHLLAQAVLGRLRT